MQCRQILCQLSHQRNQENFWKRDNLDYVSILKLPLYINTHPSLGLPFNWFVSQRNLNYISRPLLIRHGTFLCISFSFPLEHLYGEGSGTPLQYPYLENPLNGRAWWAAVHGVAKSQTQLSDFTFIFHFHALEKEMATHSSVLAWRIPSSGEPGGLLSMGSYRVGHNWSNLAAAEHL